jgi:hypothetical protein
MKETERESASAFLEDFFMTLFFRAAELLQQSSIQAWNFYYERLMILWRKNGKCVQANMRKKFLSVIYDL